MPADTYPVACSSLVSRSAVSNGSRVLNGVDGRSAMARRFRDLIANFSRDLGGLEHLTEAEHALVRQAASLVVQAERLQADVVNGKPVDPDELIRLTSESRHALASIRKREKPKPQLSDYLTTRSTAA
jgi:hypothetical protein